MRNHAVVVGDTVLVSTIVLVTVGWNPYGLLLLLLLLQLLLLCIKTQRGKELQTNILCHRGCRWTQGHDSLRLSLSLRLRIHLGRHGLVYRCGGRYYLPSFSWQQVQVRSLGEIPLLFCVEKTRRRAILRVSRVWR